MTFKDVKLIAIFRSTLQVVAEKYTLDSLCQITSRRNLLMKLGRPSFTSPLFPAILDIDYN